MIAFYVDFVVINQSDFQSFSPMCQSLKRTRQKFKAYYRMSICFPAGLRDDFQCTVRSDGDSQLCEVEECLSVFTEAAKRDPETSIVILSLGVVYTPLRPCRLEL